MNKTPMLIAAAIAIFIFFISFGCSKKNLSPEQYLKRYIEYKFADKQEKEDILAMLTGPLLLQVQNMSDSDFKAFTDSRNIKMDNLKITNSKCTDSSCYLTYFLSYDTYENGKKNHHSEMKKIAELRFEGNVWKIYNVTNVKTYNNSLDEIKIAP